jgi:alpha-galactosidase
MSTNLTLRLVLSTVMISAVAVAGAGAPSALATSAPTASVPVTGGQSSTTSPIATTPPMGWNSWNSFGCSVSESLIRGMADALVSSGMEAAGYRYVVIDDCWFAPQRTGAGELRGNPQRFPSGMKALADDIHGKGLKFGIYEVPTEETCAQRGGVYPGMTGSRGHEAQDARTFASWGVDYLKYDWCSPQGTQQDKVDAFAKMRDALRATGRPIVYSINPNSYSAEKTGNTYDWSAITNLVRISEDIKPVWRTANKNTYPLGVTDIIDMQADPALAARAHPGYWNDPDMLEVGVYNTEEGWEGLTDIEATTHFSMWALTAAPLIAGNDVRQISPPISRILTNRAVIAVDQDPMGVQGRKVRDDGFTEVWAKPLAHGRYAVVLFNRGPRAERITTTAAQVGVGVAGPYLLHDLWARQTTRTTGQIGAVVPAHGVAMFTLRQA